MGAGANGPGGRRALELILSGGLKSLARPAKPVRRAASRDSVLSQPQPLLEGKSVINVILGVIDQWFSREPQPVLERGSVTQVTVRFVSSRQKEGRLLTDLYSILKGCRKPSAGDALKYLKKFLGITVA